MLRLKPLLKKYCGKSGSVELSDTFEYAYRGQKDIVWDTEEVYDALKEAGVDPWQVLSVGKAKLKKIIGRAKDEDPSLAAKLEAAGVEFTKTRFGGYPKEGS